ncbi:hypothetical protein ACHAWF_017968 [Thalassiosira exigua]
MGAPAQSTHQCPKIQAYFAHAPFVVHAQSTAAKPTHRKSIRRRRDARRRRPPSPSASSPSASDSVRQRPIASDSVR